MKNGRTRKVGAPVLYRSERESEEWGVESEKKEWEREWEREREFERKCGRRKVGGERALRVVGGADPYGWGAEVDMLTEGR